MFLQTFEGTIAGKYPIEMHLVSWGYGGLTGHYAYKKVGKKISIFGDFENETSFKLTEYVDNEHTGTFVGRFENEQRITGIWSNPKGTKNLPFELTLQQHAPDKTGWEGVWHLNEIWDGGTLLIGNVTENSLDFAISVTRTTHMGEIWGTAIRKGNNAVFKSVEFTFDEEAPEPCHLTFALHPDYIEVDQLSSTLACGFGMRAYAGGRFDKKRIEKKPNLSFGSAETDIFPNQIVHDAFKHLVGERYYEVFAFNMQVYEKVAQNPADNFSAIVVQGGVIGAFTVNEAIIMYNEKGKFWAVTTDLDEESKEQLVLRYFTNDTVYQGKLPPTLAAWCDRFPDYPLRYE